MFKQHLCHQPANEILKLFGPLLNYKIINENCNKYYMRTIYEYEANIDKFLDTENVIININFETKREMELALNPEIRLMMAESNGLTENYSKFVSMIKDFLDKKYNPDYKTVMNVIDIFTNAGLNSGVLRSTHNMKYKRTWESHLEWKPHTRWLRIGNFSKNVVTIDIHKVFQRGSGKHRQHFKKSYVSISIDYLVDSNNQLKPYFKINLPFKAEKKMHYYMLLENPDTIYIVDKDIDVRLKHIDTFESIPVDFNKIEQHFNHMFRNSIEDTIQNALRIDKNTLSEMSDQEIKEHIILVEMVKL